ncbi:WD40-repeat-containing domain protein [Syncephalis plumigaleata]|nr:WD40-repeat-containing domain protein [Syncephalis plumigaleata]
MALRPYIPKRKRTNPTIDCENSVIITAEDETAPVSKQAKLELPSNSTTTQQPIDWTSSIPEAWEQDSISTLSSAQYRSLRSAGSTDGSSASLCSYSIYLRVLLVKGRWLAAASMNGTISVYDPFTENNHTCVFTRTAKASYTDVCWANDNHPGLLAGGYGQSIEWIDLTTETTIELCQPDAFVTRLLFQPQHTNVFIAGMTRGGLILGDLRTPGVNSMVFSSDQGSEIIVASDVVQKEGADKSITVWDIASVSVVFIIYHLIHVYTYIYVGGKAIKSTIGECYTVTSLARHPTEPWIVANTQADYATIIAAQTPWKVRRSWRFQHHHISSYGIQCDISPNGQWFCSGSADGQLHIYDWYRRKHRKRLSAMPVSSRLHHPCLDVQWHPWIDEAVAISTWHGAIGWWHHILD